MKRHSILRLALGFVGISLLTASAVYGADGNAGTGLSTFISVDMVGDFNVDEDTDIASDAFNIREAEVSFYSPVDHLFEGTVNMAAHREDGVAHFELHEAVLSSSKLIPNSKIKIGQFFLGIGRLNRFHRHDWPFITAPDFFASFFDEEGISDTGIEYSYLAPLPFYLELTAGITNGWTYGHAHDAGEKPNMPTHYARLGTFLEFSDNVGMATGLNVLKRRDDKGLDMTLLGLDFVLKQSAGRYNKVLLQGEVWHSTLNPKAGPTSKALGAYIYPQYGISENFALGCRLDYMTVLTLEDGAGSEADNANYNVVPTATYKVSEFGNFRVAYNYRWDTLEDQDDVKFQTFEFQANYILGAHPAHEF